MTIPSTEVCENCGHVIGRLENAMVWGEKIVCANCHVRLRNEIRSQTRKNWWFISAIAACGLLIGLAVGILVSRNVHRYGPVQKQLRVFMGRWPWVWIVGG